MWSILPTTRRSLCGPLARGGLDPDDLGHRREADLELRGARLLGRPEALDLTAGGVEGLGERLAVVAVRPGEGLDRGGGAGQADEGAGGAARVVGGGAGGRVPRGPTH